MNTTFERVLRISDDNFQLRQSETSINVEHVFYDENTETMNRHVLSSNLEKNIVTHCKIPLTKAIVCLTDKSTILFATDKTFFEIDRNFNSSGGL